MKLTRHLHRGLVLALCLSSLLSLPACGGAGDDDDALAETHRDVQAPLTCIPRVAQCT